MKRITLKNSFHGTEIVVLSEFETASETWYRIQYAARDHNATKAQKAKEAKVRRTLCGSDDCMCGVVRS